MVPVALHNRVSFAFSVSLLGSWYQQRKFESRPILFTFHGCFVNHFIIGNFENSFTMGCCSMQFFVVPGSLCDTKVDIKPRA